nr:TlpA disulfide reductase family protein [Pseudoroseomonas coralli]
MLGRRFLLSLSATGATLTTLLPARQGIATGSQAIPAAEGLGKLSRSSPKPLPDFGFTDAEGQEKTVADFAGHPLLINLWATWCPPCVAEMPSLDRAQADLAGAGWKVLPLSSDRAGKPQVEAFFARTQVKNLGVWLDPRGAAARALGARGLPTTVVVNPAGQEVARLEGAAEWDDAAMLAALRGLIGPETSAT